MGGHCTTVCSPPHPILPASCLLQEEAEQQVQQQPDGPQRHGSPVQRRHSSAAGLGRGGSSPDPLGDLLEMEPVPPNNTDWEREVGLDMPECASKPTCKPLHTRVCVCVRACVHACVCHAVDCVTTSWQPERTGSARACTWICSVCPGSLTAFACT